MDIRTLAERELSELPLFDMTEWLARKGEYDPSFRLVASEFGVITTLLDHGTVSYTHLTLPTKA